MLELEQAVEKILAAMPPPQTGRMPLAHAAGRILGEKLPAPLDLPPFDNSAMDGYAVRAEDVVNATDSSPVRLKLCGRIEAGKAAGEKISAGECVRIFTGSKIPAGADAVVMQEDTRVEPSRPDEVLIADKVTPLENIRLQGQDVKRGTVIAEAGEILHAGKISLLAALGINEITVTHPPTVGLIATGSELREPGSRLSPGQIYESNRLALADLVSRTGAQPKVFPLVPDQFELTRKILEEAFSQCDVVITSGGVSVGDMDLVKPAFEQLGGQLNFWKVSIRPGKPFVFGRWGKKFLFGLPGNPVSAFVTFLLLVRPALLRWQGASQTALAAHPGILAEDFHNSGERRHFMRVRVDETGKIFSAGMQASHALRSLAACNGLLDVPAKTNLLCGTSVNVLRW